MTDTDQQTIINNDTTIAIYDNIPYFLHDKSWQEVAIEILNTGVEND